VTQTRHHAPERLEWGSETVEASVRGFPGRVYDPRRRSLAELLLDARRWSTRTYIVQGDRHLTYAQHEQAVANGRRLLLERGIGPGDTVMLAGVNSIEWVVAMWSLLAAGAVAALANFWWSDSEIAGAIEDVGAKLVIVDPTRLGKVPDGVEMLGIDVFDPWAGSPDDKRFELPSVHEDEAALVIFTSGSTGRPKGAILSHAGTIAAQQNLLARTGRLPQQLTDDQPAIVSMLTAPLFHLAGVGPVMTGLIVGGTVVLLKGKFDGGEALELIERQRVTVWGAVPTMVQRALDHPDLAIRDTSSLRTIALGGAPVPPELPDRIREGFPTVRRGVSEVYGMTETSGFVASASASELLERPGTTGRIMPVLDVRILNPDRDGVGEIAVRGPTVMLGYAGESTSAVDDEGFFHTGDLGRLDDDGYLYITGRSKDVIIRGGENIAARHVEEAIARHPSVKEVAVVGLPHTDLGEEVGAAVVILNGSVKEEELAEFVRPVLAYFEVPTRWWLLQSDLPTTAFGKADKALLRSQWPAP
jgi:long-chain acyl-CoA synthetase